jgi:hypothetical protein
VPRRVTDWQIVSGLLDLSKEQRAAVEDGGTNGSVGQESRTVAIPRQGPSEVLGFLDVNTGNFRPIEASAVRGGTCEVHTVGMDAGA